MKKPKLPFRFWISHRLIESSVKVTRPVRASYEGTYLLWSNMSDEDVHALVAFRQIISGGDRVDWRDDNRADSHPGLLSNQSTSATSEPASSTLLTPLRARYHKFTEVRALASFANTRR
jgi:hypothetical protein